LDIEKTQETYSRTMGTAHNNEGGPPMFQRGDAPDSMICVVFDIVLM